MSWVDTVIDPDLSIARYPLSDCSPTRTFFVKDGCDSLRSLLHSSPCNRKDSELLSSEMFTILARAGLLWALFIWVTSSECQRTQEFPHPRVNLISIWALKQSLISPLMTVVSPSPFCWIQSRILCSRLWSSAICFPRRPDSSSPSTRTSWTQDPGDSNALVKELIETAI
jgi:hypothetical protein